MRLAAQSTGGARRGAVALLLVRSRGELVDEQPAVREDQHAGGAGGLDEAGGGDRLARRGRMLEPVAAARAGIGRRRLVAVRSSSTSSTATAGSAAISWAGRRVGPSSASISSSSSLVVLVLVVVVLVVVVLVRRRRRRTHRSPRRRRPRRPAVLLGLDALEVADQRGELSGERVDLVAAQRGPGGERRLRLREDALEPEHERVVTPPVEARLERPALISSRAASSAARRTVPGRKRDGGVLAIVQKRLAAPCRCGFGERRFKVGLEA